MNQVQSVLVVSDGIVIDFLDGTSCYFPGSFLLDHVHTDGNHILLTYDLSHYVPAGELLESRESLPC